MDGMESVHGTVQSVEPTQRMAKSEQVLHKPGPSIRWMALLFVGRTVGGETVQLATVFQVHELGRVVGVHEDMRWRNENTIEDLYRQVFILHFICVFKV